VGPAQRVGALCLSHADSSDQVVVAERTISTTNEADVSRPIAAATVTFRSLEITRPLGLLAERRDEPHEDQPGTDPDDEPGKEVVEQDAETCADELLKRGSTAITLAGGMLPLLPSLSRRTRTTSTPWAQSLVALQSFLHACKQSSSTPVDWFTREGGVELELRGGRLRRALGSGQSAAALATRCQTVEIWL
jgi:hypothetical protein